jgi:hypothetical protein
MAATLAIAAPGVNWGSLPVPGMVPGDDDNLYAFLKTLYIQNVDIKARLATQATDMAAVLTAVTDAKAELNTHLLETESQIIRSITGIGKTLTKSEYTLLSTLNADGTETAAFIAYKAALA